MIRQACVFAQYLYNFVHIHFVVVLFGVAAGVIVFGVEQFGVEPLGILLSPDDNQLGLSDRCCPLSTSLPEVVPQIFKAFL